MTKVLVGCALILGLVYLGYYLLIPAYHGPTPMIVKAQHYCAKKFPGANQGNLQVQCSIKMTRMFRLGSSDVEE